MNSYEDNLSNEGFKIWVNPEVAFTMIYEDTKGRFMFGIEVCDDPKKIYLNCLPSEGDKIVDITNFPTRTRVDLAIERLKRHFENQGLCVELD